MQDAELPSYVRNDYYAILSVQLAITAAVSGFMFTHPAVREFATTAGAR